MTKKLDEPSTENIKVVDFASALSERYLTYALSTIMSRSLPDVRDGLKPVQRRLLYAMRELKLDPSSGHKKSARVVGDVIGKFHPHGDTAIYDAMVRLAQTFAQRYRLVDGQGNFGNIDGDNPAAMRYTEARMTLVAQLLLEGLDEDAVDFRATYDGEDREPVVLPGAFPNLLANGTSGIAVGMATSIPPHNVLELCDALLHIIDNPKCSVEDLVAFVQGPDFPTGGIIVEERASMLEAYQTGRGGFRLRARYEVEKLKGGTWRAVITEIPYQVIKGKVIERVAGLIAERKLPLVGDILDESAEDIRLIIEPKTRNIEPEVMMESLFRSSDLETRFSLNMNVLDKANTPHVMSLKQVLRAWLDHRQEVLVRRSNHRLGKIDRRLHLLDGFLIAYMNIDELIRIIRFEDEVRPTIMQTFGLSEEQAEAILNMRLRALRKLEEYELRKEHEELTAEKAKLEALIGSERRQWTVITKQIKALKETFSPGAKAEKDFLLARQTTFADLPEIDLEGATTAAEREPITVVISAKGWARAVKGHGGKPEDVKYKDGDKAGFYLHAQSTDRLILLYDNGRVFNLGCEKLPGGRGFGEPLSLLFAPPSGAKLVEVLLHQAGQRILLASTAGHGFLVPSDELLTNQRAGKALMTLSEGATLAIIRPVPTDVRADRVAAVASNGRLLLFPIDELPELPRGKGVILIKFKDAKLTDACLFEGEKGLTWKWGQDKIRTFTELDPWLNKRASAGKPVPTGFPKNLKFG